MRKLMAFVLPALFISGLSIASEPLPAHWVMEGQVYFAPRPDTKADLLIFKESESSWAYLHVSSDYGVSLHSQIASLKRKYPGKEVSWVRPDPVGKAQLAVSTLSLKLEAEWNPRSAGPAAAFSILLTKAQAEKLQINPGKIEVTGRLTAPVQTSQIREEILLPPEVCESLIGDRSDLGSVLVRFTKVSQKIDRRVSRYPETNSSLKLSVLRECIELSSLRGVRSMAELLATSVSRKEGRHSPRGESRVASPVIEESDFVTTPVTSIEISGG